MTEKLDILVICRDEEHKSRVMGYLPSTTLLKPESFYRTSPRCQDHNIVYVTMKDLPLGQKFDRILAYRPVNKQKLVHDIFFAVVCNLLPSLHKTDAHEMIRVL